MKQCAKSAGSLLCVWAWLLCCNPLLAVVVSTTNGNTDAQSLYDAGGPADPIDPSVAGWANVGKSSLNGTVTYLGNRWVLTAAHVDIGNNLLNDLDHLTPVAFGGNPYFVDESTITQLHNPGGSLSDLKLFRLQSDPGLPSLLDQINDSSPAGRVIMIGRGLSKVTDQQYWDGSSVPWQFDPTPPANPGSTDFSGFYTDNNGARIMRWGENTVLNTGVPEAGVEGFTTAFDDLAYTGTQPLPFEAQGSNGDSGGPGFTLVGGQWKLSGIMITLYTFGSQPPLPEPDGLPASLYDTAVFENLTLFADVSVYRDEILAIVPEPQSYLLALVAAAALALVRRRRR